MSQKEKRKLKIILKQMKMETKTYPKTYAAKAVIKEKCIAIKKTDLK